MEESKATDGFEFSRQFCVHSECVLLGAMHPLESAVV
jgi:hypothetical protein